MIVRNRYADEAKSRLTKIQDDINEMMAILQADYNNAAAAEASAINWYINDIAPEYTKWAYRVLVLERFNRETLFDIIDHMTASDYFFLGGDDSEARSTEKLYTEHPEERNGDIGRLTNLILDFVGSFRRMMRKDDGCIIAEESCLAKEFCDEVYWMSAEMSDIYRTLTGGVEWTDTRFDHAVSAVSRRDERVVDAMSEAEAMADKLHNETFGLR